MIADGFRQVEQLPLNPGDSALVETEAFCLAVIAGAVRGGALRTTVYRDESPGARNIPLQLTDAELLVHNPHRPVLITGDELAATGMVGPRQYTLLGGQITGLFVYDETA